MGAVLSLLVLYGTPKSIMSIDQADMERTGPASKLSMGLSARKCGGNGT